MSEKTLRSPRMLLSVTGFSMLFLIISSFFLFHSVINPFKPSSVFKFVVVDDEHVYIKPKENDEPLTPSPIKDTHERKDDEVKPLGDTGQNERTIATSLGGNAVCDKNKALLRVYMYDMPPEFHFGLLDWKPGSNTIWPDVSNPSQVPRYPGGLNLQHSIEYWLTLDLLSSNVKGIDRPCTVFRVNNPREADFIFVPFFASLSYNRHSKVHSKEKVSLNRKLQNKLIELLMRRPEWRKSRGKDHIIVAHHPNSILYARRKLSSATFLLADFGRYAAKTANPEKDIIAPYKHVVKTISDNSSLPFERRPTLIYFQGAIYRKDVSNLNSIPVLSLFCFCVMISELHCVSLAELLPPSQLYCTCPQFLFELVK